MAGDGGFQVGLFNSCGKFENADMAPSGPRTLETNVWYRYSFALSYHSVSLLRLVC